jgi:uncharacterized protein (DUF2336 family)
MLQSEADTRRPSTAAMQPSQLLMSELETALRSGSIAKRTEMLRRVTDLFFSKVDHFSSEHLGLLDEVMTKAVAYIEGKVVAELSTRLAPVARAPEGIIRRLANDDDVAIAGPVLQQSEQLNENELIEIARAKGRDHLLKISSRSHLGEAVTDILVDRGDSAVRHTVAANAGARFSEVGFSKLVIYAEQDENLLATVAERADIPPLLLRHVLSRATETVRERLLAKSSPEQRNAVRKALKDVSNRVNGNISAGQYLEAERRLASITQDTNLTRAKLRECAAERRMPEAIVALSFLCGVPIDHVDHLVNTDSHFGTLVLCKAIGLDWPIVSMILRAKSGRATVQDVADLSQQYEQLSVSSAQRILRFWQSRQDQT